MISRVVPLKHRLQPSTTDLYIPDWPKPEMFSKQRTLAPQKDKKCLIIDDRMKLVQLTLVDLNRLAPAECHANIHLN